VQAESGATPPVRRPRRRLPTKAKIGLGLVLTLLGLFVLGATVPTAPGTLERAIAITGLGAVALWLGGILLGSGGRRAG